MVGGLFCGRVLADFTFLPLFVWVVGAVLVSVAGSWLLRRVSWAQSWPLFLLLIYVFYPEIDPRWAWSAAAMTVLVILINFLLNGGEATGNRPSGEPATSTPIAPPLRLTPYASRTIPFLLFFATLSLYICTLAPDILPADNGEFQYTGTLLGVAHPPGFPLYTLLSWLMTKLPLAATPAYKINLLSAFTSAATVVLVYLAVSRWPLAVGKYAPVRLTPHASRLGGVAAAITLATSTTFWAQATTANIRSLTAFFVALALYAA